MGCTKRILEYNDSPANGEWTSDACRLNESLMQTLARSCENLRVRRGISLGRLQVRHCQVPPKFFSALMMAPRRAPKSKVILSWVKAPGRVS